MTDEIKNRILELYAEIQDDKNGVIKDSPKTLMDSLKTPYHTIKEQIQKEFGEKIPYFVDNIRMIVALSKINDKEILDNVELIKKASIIVATKQYNEAKEIFDKQGVVTGKESFSTAYLNSREKVSQSITTSNPDEIINFLQEFKKQEVGCRGYTKVEFGEEGLFVSFDKYKLHSLDTDSCYISDVSKYLYNVTTWNNEGVFKRKAQEVLDWANKIVEKYSTPKDNFLKTIAPTIEKLDAVFKADLKDFNQDGGFGYQMKKGENSVFIWSQDKNGCDVKPEQFDIKLSNNYNTIIQVEINDDIKVLDDVNEAVDFISKSFEKENSLNSLVKNFEDSQKESNSNFSNDDAFKKEESHQDSTRKNKLR